MHDYNIHPSIHLSLSGDDCKRSRHWVSKSEINTSTIYLCSPSAQSERGSPHAAVSPTLINSRFELVLFSLKATATLSTYSFYLRLPTSLLVFTCTMPILFYSCHAKPVHVCGWFCHFKPG
ncbi:hypothetical protein ILYODFUR_034881, partial [Ilyodon furcidens]